MSDSFIHFADNPDDIRCGVYDVETLCGQQRVNTTNWNAEAVTCERCLEVMEERATGVKEFKSVYQRSDRPYSWLGHSAVMDPQVWMQELKQEMKGAYEKEKALMELLAKQKQLAEILARVKKKQQFH